MILYRQKALNRLSSAEELDRALAVTSARQWLVLLTIMGLLGAVAVWSIVGEVATYVEAQGVIVNRGGTVVDAVAVNQGRLDALAIAVGDEIDKGDVVAIVVNDEIEERHAGAVALVQQRKRELGDLEREVADEDTVASANYARYREHLDELEDSAQEMLDFARNNFDNNRELFENDLISRVNLEQSQRELNEARRALLALNRDRDALEAGEIGRRNDQATRIRNATALLRDAERQASALKEVVSTGLILAPISGRVIEIKVASGAVVLPGQAVASIRTGAPDLQVLLYVPPAEGKWVGEGMPALVTPMTVRREEFGSILATVESVSAFPASLEGMIAVLQNQSLAMHLCAQGPPYAGRVALTSDPATASGFAWTSPRASTQTLTSGTLALVEIKTRTQPPITLAIPLLKEFFGIR